MWADVDHTLLHISLNNLEMSQFSLDSALALECTATGPLQEVGIGNQVLSFHAPGDGDDGKISSIVLFRLQSELIIEAV